MKKIIVMLCLIVFTNTVFAVPNYTYTRVEDENYSASSPVGHFVNHASPQYAEQQYNTIQYVPKNTVYVSDNGFHNVNYVVESPAPAYIHDIHTPQNYNKRRVITESMRDERETADKVIDRTGRIAGTLGFLGLVTMGIIGIAHAL